MRKILLLFLLVIGIFSVSAQDNLTQMADNLPQAMGINPSLRPVRGFVSIPVIGSLNISAAIPFSLSDMVIVKNGRKYWNFNGVVSTIEKNGDMVVSKAAVDLVNVGFYVTPEDFITINATTKARAFSTMPTGLLEFMGSNEMFNQSTYNVTANTNATSWAEVGMGYSRSIGNFTVGVKLKYLNGLVSATNVEGESGFTLHQSYGDYAISSNLAFDVGGAPIVEGMNPLSSLLGNHGVAADFGVSYLSADERILATVSVSDLGKIWWQSDGTTKVISKANDVPFEYDGIGNLLDSDVNFSTVFDSLLSELGETLAVETSAANAFSTSTPITFHAMGGYALGEKLQHHLSLSFIGIKPKHMNLVYDLSIGYSYCTPNKIWQLMWSGTYSSNNTFKMGLGAVMTTGVFQLFLAVDNVVGPFRLMDVRDLGLRLGLNFFFGPISARR